MADNKKTFGISLNWENEEDALLMSWLEGMDRGGPSKAIRDGLNTQRQIDMSECELVPVGMARQLADAQREIDELRRQLATAQSAPSATASAMDPKSLTKAIADGIAAGIKQAGLGALQVLPTNGNGHGEFASATAPKYICQMCEDEVDEEGATCARCATLRATMLGHRFENI